VEAMLNDTASFGDAISSGTMWRGIEVILQGRDPRDAWAFCERICGVCTTVHALASVRSVENAARHNDSEKCGDHPQHHVR
jgi:hydrogenase large subunit